MFILKSFVISEDFAFFFH